MLDRRGFFGRIVGAVVAVFAAPKVIEYVQHHVPACARDDVDARRQWADIRGDTSDPLSFRFSRPASQSEAEVTAKLHAAMRESYDHFERGGTHYVNGERIS